MVCVARRVRSGSAKECSRDAGSDAPEDGALTTSRPAPEAGGPWKEVRTKVARSARDPLSAKRRYDPQAGSGNPLKQEELNMFARLVFVARVRGAAMVLS